MVNVKKLTKEIEQAISDNRQKKEELKRRIMVAQASIATAKQEMESATTTDSEQDFIVASDKVRFNESVIKANESK